MINILHRKRIEVTTDPQRRCYNGCHFSSELRWTAWAVLDTVPEARSEDKLRFWRELNEYAVESRGQGATQEFKLEDVR